MKTPDKDWYWYWPVEISQLNSISRCLISPCKSPLDCNVFNFIYFDWSRSFWIRRWAGLFAHNFCSGFFYLTKQENLVIHASAKFCQWLVVTWPSARPPAPKGYQCKIHVTQSTKETNFRWKNNMIYRRRGQRRKKKKKRTAIQATNFFVTTYNVFSIRRGTRKFHVTTTTAKKCTKKCAARAKNVFFFANYTYWFFFCRSRCRRRLALYIFVFGLGKL